MTSVATALGVATTAVATTAVGWYLKRSGAFYQPTVSVTEAPARRVAYKLHTGPYNSCGQYYTSAIKDLDTAKSEAAGETETEEKRPMPKNTNSTFAVFADDPALIPSKSLRYAVGVVLTEGETAKPDDMVEAQLTSMGYTIVDLPACKSVRTDFPFYNLLSILIAVRRVYPLIYGHVEKNELTPKGQESLPCYEVCSCLSHVTEYLIPVDGAVDLSVFKLGLINTTEYAKTLKKEEGDSGKKKKEEEEEEEEEEAEAAPEADFE